LMFIINVVKTTRSTQRAPADPWDARSLEWMTASPPVAHNFDAIPTVHALDEFFHRKYEENEEGEIHQVADYASIVADEATRADAHIHLPSPSYWPIIVGLGLPIVAYGIIFNHLLAVGGGVVVLMGIFGWALEPSVAPDSDYDPPADGDGVAATKELATLG
ncbi:MAG: cytochrome ubiquinol oxidase subunit I, partial [Ilumatobacteraceae bacterium]